MLRLKSEVQTIPKPVQHQQDSNGILSVKAYVRSTPPPQPIFTDT